MKRTLFALAFFGLLVGCSGQQGEPEEAAPSYGYEEEAGKQAVAGLESKSGSTVTGIATFEQEGDEVTVTIDIEGADPGVHAVHIHENGDCSADDASSAGGHWNPTGEDHGRWGEAPFHLGDLGNIQVGEDGAGSFMLTTDLWSLGTGADDDVAGLAVVVHEGADDFESQPSGAAGARVACGVIEME